MEKVFYPAKKPEPFNLFHFIIDHVIIFSIAALAAFIVPLILGGLVSGRNPKNKTAVSFYENVIAPVYTSDITIFYFEMSCLLIAFIFIIIYSIRILKRKNLLEVRSDGISIYLKHQNGLGTITETSFDLKNSIFKIVKIKGDRFLTDAIKIYGPKGELILSTKKDKLWDAEKDRETLLELLYYIEKNSSETIKINKQGKNSIDSLSRYL
ncbi:MAG: hypothetical protein ACOZCO_03525 [Bacteroidota bacterium]